MPKFNYYLRKPSSEEPTPVNFVIHWANRRLVYSTNEAIAPRHWCTSPGQRNQRARATREFPEHPEFNERLDVLLATAKTTFRQLALDLGRDPETEELRAALDLATGRTVRKRMDLQTFVLDYINSEEGRFNTVRKRPLHRATISRLRVTNSLLHDYIAFRAKRSTAPTLPLSHVDADFVAGFTAFLTQKGLAANTVVKYGRTLRLFLKRAFEAGHQLGDHVFHRRLALREEPSDQVYLTEHELEVFNALDLSDSPRLERARDLFLVGAWTGLRFGDLSRIRPEHFEGDRLRVTTSKTGKVVRIPLHPMVRTIIEKYDGHVPSGISNQKQNEYIKLAAARLPALQKRVIIGRTVGGVRYEDSRPKYEMVTTHTARRSFASNLFMRKVPARTIMAVTGHTTEQSFIRYVRLSIEDHMDLIADSYAADPFPVLKAV